MANKPAGVNFHTEDGTDGFIVQLEKQLNCKLWPVHRLDKLTSGLLLVAKNKTSCAYLSGLFADRKIEKYYLAICPSSMKKKQGTIKGDMDSARRGAYKLLKSNRNPAITQFYSTSLKPSLRVCLLKPKTGKTHQLRVALKSLGSPILGDALYSGKPEARMCLHSYALCFEYEGKKYQILEQPDFGTNLDVAKALQDNDWLAPWNVTWPAIK